MWSGLPTLFAILLSLQFVLIVFHDMVDLPGLHHGRQVRAAVGKWNAASRLVTQSTGLTGTLKGQVDRMDRLFETNQATLPQLLQARQRLIQLENSELISAGIVAVVENARATAVT